MARLSADYFDKIEQLMHSNVSNFTEQSRSLLLSRLMEVQQAKGKFYISFGRSTSGDV